jgi:hypothetical protein
MVSSSNSALINANIAHFNTLLFLLTFLGSETLFSLLLAICSAVSCNINSCWLLNAPLSNSNLWEWDHSYDSMLTTTFGEQVSFDNSSNHDNLFSQTHVRDFQSGTWFMKILVEHLFMCSFKLKALLEGNLELWIFIEPHPMRASA